MSVNQRIYVAGHRGMVGAAILRHLEGVGHSREDIITRSHSELDLTQQESVRDFFEREKPGEVYLAAARVGGILANSALPASFIYENLLIQANVIHSAFSAGVKKLLFLGSSCIYPRLAEQPIAESALLTGALEATNEPYAIAKIAGIKLCESYNRQYGETRGVDYRSVMPTNLYGHGDRYDPSHSHVIPGLIHRFHEAKVVGSPSVVVWGSGRPRREFLYVDDMASACVHIMNLDKDVYSKCTEPMMSHINVGCGSDVTIGELAVLIGELVGYSGRIDFDETKPDGTPRKLLDSSRIFGLGWHPKVGLREGLRRAYSDYLDKRSQQAGSL